MMQSNNNTVVIAAAGSGKTTKIVLEALSRSTKHIAIVTYTLNNVEEIRKKFYEKNGSVPTNVEIFPWFTFLLREGARPYQNYVYAARRIETIAFINGRSAKFVKKTNIEQYYFSEAKRIYTDKISEFCCTCNEKSKGLVLKRLEQIYDEIYIDEIQDLAGYDLDFVRLLLQSSIRILLVGDSRQATFATNSSGKNEKYRGTNIIEIFRQWERDGMCLIQHQQHSYRCNQMICDFADRLYPDMPSTTSKNANQTGHDGIFVLRPEDLSEYMEKFSPAVLRYSSTTDCSGYPALNFGDAKGLTFDRVLIFPHGPIKKYLSTGNVEHVKKSSAKFYVAVTRARYSVALVFEGACQLGDAAQFIGQRSSLIDLPLFAGELNINS